MCFAPVQNKTRHTTTEAAVRNSQYAFTTTWRIHAPLRAVWIAIEDCARWPEWWKSVERVEAIEVGDTRGIGALHRYTWKGALPYRLVFDMRVTRIEPLVALDGYATGAVEGSGRWRFSEQDGVTVIRYEWQVRTMRPWMNLVAPLARPLFQWNHDHVMREGGKGLARLLDVPLIDIEHG